MPLLITVQARPVALRKGDEFEIIESLEDDGCYWFLRPLFDELERRTGHAIRFGEIAILGGADLNELAETIAEARQRIKSRPEKWNVRTGVQPAPKKRDLYAEVRKGVLKMLLLDLEAAIEKARAQELYLIFWGD